MPQSYLRLLQECFGISPRTPRLYAEAISHRSTQHGEPSAPPPTGSVEPNEAVAANVGHGLPTNERLEFIGDAVLALLVKDHLFHAHPELSEGAMTQVCAQVLSRRSLNALASRIGITDLLYSFNANLRNQPKRARHVGGNALEALVAAIYLDQGFEAAQRALESRVLCEWVDWDYLLSHRLDAKTELLQRASAQRELVEYDTVETAPCSGRFLSTLYVEGAARAQAFGSSKREAEMRVSEHYLTLGEEASAAVPAE